MHVISWLAEKLLASRKGLCSFLNDNRSPKADIHERKYKDKNRVNAPNLSMCTFPKLIRLLQTSTGLYSFRPHYGPAVD